MPVIKMHFFFFGEIKMHFCKSVITRNVINNKHSPARMSNLKGA